MKSEINLSKQAIYLYSFSKSGNLAGEIERCLYSGGSGGRVDMGKWSGDPSTILLAVLQHLPVYILEYGNSVQILLCLLKATTGWCKLSLAPGLLKGDV